METYRAAARESVRRAQNTQTDSYILDISGVSTNPSLKELWEDIKSNDTPRITENVCENLLVAEAFFTNRKSAPLNAEDVSAVKDIFSWNAAAILPSEEFVGAWEDAELGDMGEPNTTDKFRTQRLKTSIGTSVLRYLDRLLPIYQLDEQLKVHVIPALATFTSRIDPWTTESAFNNASQLLEALKLQIYGIPENSLAPLLGDILRTVIKPLFAKTKSNAITAAGRKNEHPIPMPRFDQSVFDEEAKPWRYRDVWAVTVLKWIVGEYRASDHIHIEAQFPLLVPPILSLIDDDNLAYKAAGCSVLNTLLSPLFQARSDILRRTNLDSVFQDALSPCLLSIPTITPENHSIHLLSVAYPAFFSVIRTRYPETTTQLSSKPTFPTLSSAKQADKNSTARLCALTRLVRHHILSSYTHISNPRAVQPISSLAPLASYPHPDLSTLLLTQLSQLIPEFGISITPHLQEIVPLVTETLTNPFGTACLPLLVSAARVMEVLVMNGWMRMWHWRGDVMKGLCAAWIHLDEDEADVMREQGRKGVEDMEMLRGVLRDVVVLLRISVEEVAGEKVKIEVGDGGDVVNVDAEFRELADSDERLKGLLFPKD